jgi:peptidoglycan/xylan/chitin deacetylase (PgdA/CDA1 family)/SAM-dependent methyltransferase
MSEFLMTTSWDDGAPSDMRLATLLRKYRIPATFYIAPRNRERPVLEKKEIVSLAKYFEIGGHTMHHVDLTRLSVDVAQQEIVAGKEYLEKIIGEKISSFCYPKGRVTKDIKQLVGLAGFSSARTVDLFATSVEDQLLLPTTVHAYNHNPLVYLRQGTARKLFYSLVSSGFFKDWEILAKRSFDWCLENNRMFHLWGHSWEIDKRQEWDKLERVLRYIAERSSMISRKTNGGVIEYLAENKRRFYNTVLPSEYEKSYATKFDILREWIEGFDVKGIHILDIGCGTGGLAELFVEASYTGIDISEQFIHFARKSFAGKRKIFLKRNFLQVPRLGKQDLIFILGMFEDEPNPFAELLRIRSFVKPGTRVIFSLHNAADPVSGFRSKMRGELWGRLFPYTSFTPEFLRQELEIFCKKEGYSFRIFSSFGSFVTLGSTLFVTLDKC